MPAISSFFGIVIYMYCFDDERHQLPHVHAKYQGMAAAFSLLDGERVAGRLPRPQTRLVQRWIGIHREELLTAWRLAVAGQPPFCIDPLT